MLLDVAIIIAGYFKSKKSGYQAPEFNEDIDDFNTITVGYDGEHGK
jgi:hypothetical protein